MEQRVLEANGVSVAPSVELGGVDEPEGLHGPKTAPGDFFAFDIETSCNALKEEPHLASTALRTQHSGIVGRCLSGHLSGCGPGGDTPG